MIKRSLGLAVLATSTLAPAQDETDIAAMLEAMSPGAEHVELMKGAGEWLVETKITMPGMDGPMTSLGRAVARPVLGGRYLEIDQSGSIMGMPAGSKVLLGFDKTRKQHFSVALQTTTTGPMIAWGEARDDGSVHFEGTIYEHPTPEGRPFRHEFRWLDDDTFHIDVFDRIDDEWVLVVEETHRRRTPLIDLELTGWDAVRLEDQGDGSTAWSNRNGVLVCAGEPKGFLRTKESFANYELDFQWRWAGEAGNSGLLVHCGDVPGPIGGWPESLEVQLRSGLAGDFFELGETISVPDDEARRQRIRVRRLDLGPDEEIERPVGEWNHMRVRCEDGTVRVWINDLAINAGTDCSATSGPICLQSEGAEIWFRDVGVVRLP